MYYTKNNQPIILTNQPYNRGYVRTRMEPQREIMPLPPVQESDSKNVLKKKSNKKMFYATIGTAIFLLILIMIILLVVLLPEPGNTSK